MPGATLTVVSGALAQIRNATTSGRSISPAVIGGRDSVEKGCSRQTAGCTSKATPGTWTGLPVS